MNNNEILHSAVVDSGPANHCQAPLSQNHFINTLASQLPTIQSQQHQMNATSFPGLQIIFNNNSQSKRLKNGVKTNNVNNGKVSSITRQSVNFQNNQANGQKQFSLAVQELQVPSNQNAQFHRSNFFRQSMKHLLGKGENTNQLQQQPLQANNVQMISNLNKQAQVLLMQQQQSFHNMQMQSSLSVQPSYQNTMRTPQNQKIQKLQPEKSQQSPTLQVMQMLGLGYNVNNQIQNEQKINEENEEIGQIQVQDNQDDECQAQILDSQNSNTAGNMNEPQRQIQRQNAKQNNMRRSQHSFNSQSKQPFKEQIYVISSNLIPQLTQTDKNSNKKTNQLSKDCPQQQVLDPVQQQLLNSMQLMRQNLIICIQEIAKPVIQRSEDLNYLKQIIDLKTRKLKPKYTDSSIFFNILLKENQRIQLETFHLSKTANIRVEDRPLIKKLQKSVKKMIKPFKGLNFDDFLHAEIHLNEIMVSQQDNQQLEIMKESRKRHMRILTASLKDTTVDPQVVISICVQVSRQAFFNELLDYFSCAFENVVNNQAYQMQITNTNSSQNEVQNYLNLKKMIQKAKAQAKVQINHEKKTDKMLKVLVDQNTDILKQITNYREKYEQKKNQEGNCWGENDYSTMKAKHSRNRMFASINGDTEMNSLRDSYILSQKKQNISVDPGMLEPMRQSQINSRVTNRSDNKTMQNFYYTPQVNSNPKFDSTLNSMRLDNQKIISHKSTQLAPLSKSRLSSLIGQDSFESSQLLINFERIDYKNLKKITQLPTLYHNTGINTPNKVEQTQQQQDMQRGNSSENFLKNLQNKKKLQPLQEERYKFAKTLKNNHKNGYTQIAKHVQQAEVVKKSYSIGIFKGKQRLNKLVSFSNTDVNLDSIYDTNNKSLNNINIKHNLTNSNYQRKPRTIKTSTELQRLNSKSNFDIDPQTAKPIQNLHQYSFYLRTKFDVYLNCFRNREKIVSFMLNHFARGIQRYYRKRFQQKIKAKCFILKHYKKYILRKRCKEDLAYKMNRLKHRRAVRVIEKQYRYFKLKIQLRQRKFNLNYNLTKEFIQKIILIQRNFKKFLSKKQNLYRQIIKTSHLQQSIYDQLKKKYVSSAIVDSQLFHLELSYFHHQFSLDEYIYEQQQKYLNSIDQYEEQLETAVEESLDKREWSFNPASREWSNLKHKLTLKNYALPTYCDKQIGSSSFSSILSSQNLTTPLPKLIEINKKILVPNQEQVEEMLESLSTVGDMMRHELNQQRIEEIGQIKGELKKFKISRFEE